MNHEAMFLEPKYQIFFALQAYTTSSNKKTVSATELAEFLAEKLEINLSERQIVNALNPVPSTEIRKQRVDGKLHYELMGLGRERLNKKLSSLNFSQTPYEKNFFSDVSFHPRIVRASKTLFENGHYPQAIFEAFKEINIMVKEKSGCLNLDGKTLMSKVFRKESPILKLNNLSKTSDLDEQEGFQFLFMGAIVGIRNPKGHERIEQKDPNITIEYLAFASLLAKIIDKSQKNELPQAPEV